MIVSALDAIDFSSTIKNNTIATSGDIFSGISIDVDSDNPISHSTKGNSLTVNSASWCIKVWRDGYNVFSIPDLENANDFILGTTALGRVYKY